MIVEFIGIKNGKIVRRFKEDCTQVDYDEDNIVSGLRITNFKELSDMYDRVKLFVDGEEWLNKSLISIDFSSFEIGGEYQFSNDMQTWHKNILLAIDEDSELEFKVGIEDSGIYSWWRYAREII